VRFTPALRVKFLEHIRAGTKRSTAARVLGFDYLIILAYIGAHPEFEREVLDAEAEASEDVEKALFQAALEGNVSAAKEWLALRSRDAPVFLEPPVEEPPPPPEPEEEEPPPIVADEDGLFPPNVTHMDPRARRKKS